MQVSEVSIEIGTDGWVCGWALALPGCFWHASDEANCLAQALTAIGEFREWLGSHGEPLESSSTVDVQVIERQQIPKPLAGGSTGALFEPERKSLAEEDLQKALRWMDYSRADLLSVLRELPQEAWVWSPGGEADAWTLRTHVRHLANVELYYCLRLVPQLPGLEIFTPDDTPQALLEFLDYSRQVAKDFLLNLTDEQRAMVILPYWQPGRWVDELWSARKVLRRFIYHERFHQRDIARWKSRVSDHTDSHRQ